MEAKKAGWILITTIYLSCLTPTLTESNWLCADIKCEETISLAKALVRYEPDETLENSVEFLEFEDGDILRILSRPEDFREANYLAEIEGVRGYVPKNLIREEEFKVENPQFVVQGKPFGSGSGGPVVPLEVESGSQETPPIAGGTDGELHSNEAPGTEVPDQGNHGNSASNSDQEESGWFSNIGNFLWPGDAGSPPDPGQGQPQDPVQGQPQDTGQGQGQPQDPVQGQPQDTGQGQGQPQDTGQDQGADDPGGVMHDKRLTAEKLGHFHANFLRRYKNVGVQGAGQSSEVQDLNAQLEQQYDHVQQTPPSTLPGHEPRLQHADGLDEHPEGSMRQHQQTSEQQPQEQLMHQSRPMEQLHTQHQPPIQQQQQAMQQQQPSTEQHPPPLHTNQQQPPTIHSDDIMVHQPPDQQQPPMQQQQPPVQQPPVQQQQPPVQQQQPPMQQQQPPVQQQQPPVQQQQPPVQQQQPPIQQQQPSLQQQQPPMQQQQPPVQQQPPMQQQQPPVQQQPPIQQQQPPVQQQQPSMQQQQPPVQQQHPMQQQQPPVQQPPSAQPPDMHGKPAQHSPPPNFQHPNLHQSQPHVRSNQGKPPELRPPDRQPLHHPPAPPLAERGVPHHHPAPHPDPTMHHRTEPPHNQVHHMNEDLPQQVHTSPTMDQATEHSKVEDSSTDMERWRMEEQRRRQQIIQEKEWLEKQNMERRQMEEQRRKQQIMQEKEKEWLQKQNMERREIEEQRRKQQIMQEKEWLENNRIAREQEQLRLENEHRERKLMEEKLAQNLKQMGDLGDATFVKDANTQSDGKQDAEVNDHQQPPSDENGNILLDHAHMDLKPKDHLKVAEANSVNGVQDEDLNSSGGPDMDVDHRSLDATPSLDPSPGTLSASLTSITSPPHSAPTNPEVLSAADDLPLHMQATPNLPAATQHIEDLDLTEITQILPSSVLAEQAAHTLAMEPAARGMDHLQTLAQPDQVAQVNTQPLPVPVAVINDQPPGTGGIDGESEEPVHINKAEVTQGSSQGDYDNQDSQENVVNGMPTFGSTDDSQVPDTPSNDMPMTPSDLDLQVPDLDLDPADDSTESHLLQGHEAEDDDFVDDDDDEDEDEDEDEEEESVYQMVVDPEQEAVFDNGHLFHGHDMEEFFDDEMLEDEDWDESEIDGSEIDDYVDYDVNAFSDDDDDDDDASLKMEDITADENEKLTQEEEVKEDVTSPNAGVEPDMQDDSEEHSVEDMDGNNNIKSDELSETGIDEVDIEGNTGITDVDDTKPDSGAKDPLESSLANSVTDIDDQKSEVDAEIDSRVEDKVSDETEVSELPSSESGSDEKSDHVHHEKPEKNVDAMIEDISSAINSQPTQLPFAEEGDIDESDPELLSSLQAAARMSEYENLRTPSLEPSQSLTPSMAAIEPTPAMEPASSSTVVETMLTPEEWSSVQPPAGTTNHSDDQQGIRTPLEDLPSAVGSDPYSPASFMSRKTLQSGSSNDHYAEEPASEPRSVTDDALPSDSATAGLGSGADVTNTPPHTGQERMPLPHTEQTTMNPTPLDEPLGGPEDTVEPGQEGPPPTGQTHSGEPPLLAEPLEEQQGATEDKDTPLDPYLQILPESLSSLVMHEPFGFPPQVALVLLLSSMSFLTLLLFCSCFGTRGGAVSHVQLANINELEQRVFLLSKERDGLEEQLNQSQARVQDLSSHMTTSGHGAKELAVQLENVQFHNKAHEATISELQQHSQSLQINLLEREEQVQLLQAQLTEASNQVESLDAQLMEVQGSLGASEATVRELDSQTASMQEELAFLQQSKDQLLLEAQGWDERVHELEEQMVSLREEEKVHHDNIAFKDNEIEVLKDCLVQLKALQPLRDTEAEGSDDEDAAVDEDAVKEKIQAMTDVSKARAEMKQYQEETENLRNKLKVEVEGRKELEEQVSKLEEEAAHLREGHQEAESRSKEANTKLSVLADYFEKKEVLMQKELGEQEVLRKQNACLAGSADEVRREMEDEMASYRTQVEDLKKEIENVERDFRNQIAANEKKAHENWLIARQAERGLKEAKIEASMLRQKLLDFERSKESNGVTMFRPLPGLPGPPGPPGPPGLLNGPPPPPFGPDGRPLSRELRSPLMRDSPMMGDRRPFLPNDRPIPPMMRDRMPPPPHPMDRPLPGDARSPPPPFDRHRPPEMRSPPPPMRTVGPPPDLRDMPPPLRRTPPYDRRTPPHLDGRSPAPFDGRRTPPPPPRGGPHRGPPPPGYRGGPPPPDMRPGMPPPPRHRTSSPRDPMYWDSPSARQKEPSPRPPSFV